MFGVTVSNAGVRRWCLSHSCADQYDSSSFYAMRSDETHESRVSQASTSHTDVSQDNISHSNIENDETDSHACVHYDSDQDNTSQGTVSQVSTQDTAGDSMSTQKPSDIILINIDDEAAKDFTRFSFQVSLIFRSALIFISFIMLPTQT